MSKIAQTMSWFREVSVLAEDEQRRAGHPEIDAEHLLLGLIGIGGAVTDALADRGVTLPRAREACAALHERRAASLGVALAGTAGERIPDHHAPRGFVFRADVRRMLERAASRPVPDVALLRALCDEPSGHARDVLAVLDVDAGELLGAVGSSANAEDAAPAGGQLRRFLPAPPEKVWELLSDPERFLAWNDFEFEAAAVDDGVVRARVRERGIDGRPLRVRPAFRDVQLALARSEAPRVVEWERSYPAAGASRGWTLRAQLAPSGSGTELALAFVAAGAAEGGVLARLGRIALRPLRPLMIRGHLRGKADNISRALRQPD